MAKQQQPRVDEPEEDEGIGECPGMSAKPGHGDAPVMAASGLTSRQQQAVEALLREPTLTRAAALAGVHERTLRRWLAAAAFRAAVLRARREAFAQAVGLTQRYAPVAVATLVKVMNDATASASARVAAAAVLLQFGREGIELDDLAERVEALERAALSVDVSTGVAGGRSEGVR